MGNQMEILVLPMNLAKNTAKPRHLETAQSLKKDKNHRKTAKIIVNQRANRQKQQCLKTRKRTQLVKLVKLTQLVKIVKVRLVKLSKVHLVRLAKSQLVRLVKDQIVTLAKLLQPVKVTKLVNLEEQMRISEVEISQNFRRKSQNAILLHQNRDQSLQKNPEALALVEAWKILTNSTKWPRPHPPKNLGKVMPAKGKKGNN